MTWLIAWLIAGNAVTAALYTYDKMAAPRHWRRIRERTLWICNALGGVLGAWAVFLVLRHKTRHRSFWAVQAVATVAWATVIAIAGTR